MIAEEPTFKPIHRKQLTEQVIQELQERISLGKFVPGTKLPPEPELMIQLGVGRSTLREAIRVLAYSGLLEVRQGDGTYVRGQVDSGDSLNQRLRRAAILEVYEVRRMLEIELARLAAQRRDEQDLAAMRASLDARQHNRRGKDSGFLDNDIAFHQAVATASKNAVASDLYHSFTTVLRDTLAKLIADPLSIDQTTSHEQLYDAIARQDAEAAAEWTANYLDNTMRQLRKGLELLPFTTAHYSYWRNTNHQMN